MYADELEDPSTVQSIFATNRGYAGLFAPLIPVYDEYESIKVIG